MDKLWIFRGFFISFAMLGGVKCCEENRSCGSYDTMFPQKKFKKRVKNKRSEREDGFLVFDLEDFNEAMHIR